MCVFTRDPYRQTIRIPRSRLFYLLHRVQSTIKILRFLNIFHFDSGFTLEKCDRYEAEGKVGAKLIATREW